VLSAIRQAAKRGETLTQQLLSFARRQPMRPEIVDLPKRIGDMFTLLERLLSGSIRVVVDMPANVWKLNVDPSQLELALLNVCLNARDAMAAGGTLTLTARNVQRPDGETGAERRYVAISIADTGVGIPPELMSRVLEPFFTTKDVGKGSGLGLSQAYGFAQQSGGTLTISSDVGRGTTVSFLLPAADAAAGAAAPTFIDREAPRTLTSGTVLLVEDDLAVAELTAALLEHAGYRVEMAHSGATALHMLRQGRNVDVVFSDVVMPGSMDGIELARCVRKEFPSVPVLLTTGFGDRTFDVHEIGIQLITKPYDPVEVMATIDRLIVEARAKPA
jgi:CheY-like chemotaxis protein